MTITDAKEVRFRKVINLIGITMLIFLALFNILVVIWSVINEVLAKLLTPVAAEVTGQLLYAVVYLASFMVPAFILRSMLGKSYRHMMLEKTLPRDFAAYVVVGIAAILTIAYLNAMMLEIFNFSSFTSQITDEPEKMTNYQVVLSFITTAMVPGICEEFLFRGAILSNLKPYGKAPAIIISAVLFGLMHQNPGQFLYATAAGLVLGWVAYETGSIWCGIIMHFFNNFISVAETAVSQRLSDSVANAVLPMFECLLFAAGVVCAVYIIAKHEKKKRGAALLADGIFGKPLAEVTDAEAPSVKLAPGRASRLFFTPTMIIFIILACASMALLILASLFSGLLGGWLPSSV